MRRIWTLLVGLAFAQGVLAQGNLDRAVKVSVNNGVISVSPDPANMSKNHHRIVWSLETPGFAFAQDGIVIAGDKTDYGECGSRGNSTTIYVCKKLKHIDKKQFKYDVNLVNAKGQRISLDPTIANE
ncbi:MAG: hypothetical protein WCH60_00850 [Burkholderiales bacterium]